MVDNVVDNWSMRTHRRAEIKLELSPKTTAAAIQQCIDAIKKILESKADQLTSSGVHLTDITKAGITVTAEYLTAPINLDEFNNLKENIHFAIKKILEENEFEMAASAGAVTIINELRDGV
jgi:MscS family membrane protein